jgi:hypothetical protein
MEEPHFHHNWYDRKGNHYYASTWNNFFDRICGEQLTSSTTVEKIIESNLEYL